MPKSVRGTINKTTVLSGTDLLPSVARLAGVTLPSEELLDGEDLSGTFFGKAQTRRSKPLFWNRPPDRPGPEASPWPELAMREGNWKFLMMRDGSNPQLFDLQNDLGEAHNLAAKNPEMVQRLTRSLQSWWQGLPESQNSVKSSPGQKEAGH